MASTGLDASQPQAYGYPLPVEHKAAYQASPVAHNPPLRGIALTASSFVVAHSSAIGKYFYGNTGFSKSLAGIKALDECLPSYVPNVVPHPAPAALGASQPSLLLNQDEYRKPPVHGDKPSSKRSRTVLDYHDAYRSGKTTPTAVVEALLPLIRRDVSNATEHSVAFISSKPELVLKAAREATERWQQGKPLGILDGVPIAMKDDIDLKGYPRTLGLQHALEAESKHTSWCITKLEEQGAVVIGKCNMHEIGMDTTNNNPSQGTPRNPYNRDFYTGGSTGGGAYAVAAGLVPLVQGSDAGGSIRIPSSYCGLYGLKPTHNRVSVRPTLNVAASTAAFGPLAGNMADLELAYRLMATPDAADSISKLYQAPSRPTERHKVLGIYRQWFDESDPNVRDSCNKAIDWLQKVKGYEIVDITIPYVHTGQAAHALTTLAEIGSVIGDKQSVKTLSHPNRILTAIGSHAPAKDFFAAQKLRTLISQHLAYLWQQHPGMIIVTPTVPFNGWRIEKGEIGKGVSNGNKTIRSMTYIYLANFCGLPSLSGPVGYGDVPIGLVGSGEWGADDGLVEFGFDLEAYLASSEGGGKRLPPTFVDVLGDLLGKHDAQSADGPTVEKTDASQNEEVGQGANGVNVGKTDAGQNEGAVQGANGVATGKESTQDINGAQGTDKPAVDKGPTV